MTDEKQYLTAREAAAELNVSRATLYAYVSRGQIRSEASGNSRSRLYRADDVRALRARKGPGRDPESIAGDALNFGLPVLDSSLTLITDGRLYYRGRDAARLARAASLETVAGLLWDAGKADPFAENPPPDVAVPDGLDGMVRCQAMLPWAAEADARAYNLEAAGVARTGARILRLLAAGVAGTPAGDAPIHGVLGDAWGVDAAGADLLRAALVLCADHELNASTFTVRCVASTRATPYAAVLAGLAALQGPRHGGITGRVAALFNEFEAAGNVEAAVAERLSRGDSLPGFGHPLYPAGDIRAQTLLAMLREADAVEWGDRVLAAVKLMTDGEPTIDVALVLLARALGLPQSAPLSIFAVGRCVGWIAHAQEQYRQGNLIRPRARYVGEPPQPAHPER